MTEGQHRDVFVAQRVAHEIDSDPSLDTAQVEVGSDSGVVVLRGTVANEMARARAEEAARRVPGVRDLANDLVVLPCGDQDRSDAQIAAAARHALEWDVRVPHERIQTSVTGGVVTLAGRLDRWSESRAAEGVVSTLAGVRSVVNDLEVSECVSPRDVHRAIVKALTRHALEEANHLDVGSFQGEVTISGEVTSSAEKQILLHAVRAVPGVRTVRSLIRVRSADGEPSADPPV